LQRNFSLDDIGDADSPPGSQPWSRYFTLRAKKTRNDVDSSVDSLRFLINKLDRHEAWKTLGYASFNIFCLNELDLTDDDLAELLKAKRGETVGAVLRPHGANRFSADRDDNIMSTPKEQGDSAEYIEARLRRDRPDLAARVEAGELTPHAAAIEAGFKLKSITVPDDPQKAAKRLLRWFSGDRLVELIANLKQGLDPD
jgi:hypothetical protein